MRVWIEGVGHLNNGPLYDLEDAKGDFLTAVKRALFRLEHEEGDARVKVCLDINVEYETPKEVNQ